MRILHSLLLLVLFKVSLEETFDFPPSPCPQLFSYQTEGNEPGRWFGIINLKPKLFTLNIVLDRAAYVLGTWIGYVTTKDNVDFEIRTTNTEMRLNRDTEVKFFVQYNQLVEKPILVGIRLNGDEICDLYHTYKRPMKQVPANSTPEVGQHVHECGIVKKLTSNLLILNGKPALEGQWPWHIALYQSNNVDDTYSCGGTLVSQKHVITAAHCVTLKGTNRVVNFNRLTIYLGRHNLKTFSNGIAIRFVEAIRVFPEYNASTKARDVAILVMKEPVTYSEWIQPACLWPDNLVNLINVVGKLGSVVGWGIDERGMPAPELTHVYMPVVEQETCVWSYSEFYGKFASEYTFCAGFRNGSSVCNGDSGGGMMFKLDNVWYLRGLVSISVSKTFKSKYACNTNHYTVFTDLAKFLPWLRNQISDNPRTDELYMKLFS